MLPQAGLKTSTTWVVKAKLLNVTNPYLLVGNKFLVTGILYNKIFFHTLLQ